MKEIENTVHISEEQLRRKEKELNKERLRLKNAVTRLKEADLGAEDFWKEHKEIIRTGLMKLEKEKKELQEELEKSQEVLESMKREARLKTSPKTSQFIPGNCGNCGGRFGCQDCTGLSTIQR